mmetsp:Transcript_2664/g.3553  ORF Transcript_2664/g.3553 Transcript_2664/m.3553 type:complete len:112 (+) Transcript_2664:33-368(+)
MTTDDEVGEKEHEQETPSAATAAAASASPTVESQSEWSEVRRSGRATRAPERLIEEMAAVGVITQQVHHRCLMNRRHHHHYLTNHHRFSRLVVAFHCLTHRHLYRLHNRLL